VRSDFVLDPDNFSAVAAICTQLDGLPLAIELIAARIRLMSPQALLTKLNNQFVLSADGMRSVPPRQKTLHNAISWSYKLLSTEEQELFARLSVFSGGFTLDAAEAIFSSTITHKSIYDLLASLSDKSLIQRTIDFRGEPRFSMLVTIQQFALDRLRHTASESAARNWHLAYFLDLAERANQEIHGPHQVEWIDHLEMEHDNFRVAFDWCISDQQTESSLRLFGALGWFRHIRSYLGEMYNGIVRIKALPDAANFPRPYAKALNLIGRSAWLQGDYSYAQMLLTESRELWQALGDDGERGLAEALDFLGMVALWNEADVMKAESLFKQGMELYQKSCDQQGLAESLFHLGISALHRNDDRLALSLFEQSLSLFRKLGDALGIARVSQKMGEQFLKQKRPEKARLFFEQHLILDEKIQFKQGIVVALASLGDAYRHQGDYSQAEQFYERGLVIARKHSLKDDQCWILNAQGFLELHRENYLLAERHFRDCYNLRYGIHKIWSAIDFLYGQAAVAAGLNEFERAARLHGAAQALESAFDLPDISYDRVECDRLIQIARRQLGEERFDVFIAEGRAMTMEQAVEYGMQKEE